MELRDGFIVGIFNYCDRWCETCAFTSRCRLFADVAEAEASQDPALKAIVDAPPLPRDIPPPPPRWLQEMIDEMNEIAAEPMTSEEMDALEPKLPRAHEIINERAMAYCMRVHYWLRDADPTGDRQPADPVAVIAWFASLNGSKIHRALSGLAEDDGDREFPPDHDGSAKVAMIGVARSHAAWLDLVSAGRVRAAEAEPFIADLVWLGERLEEVFPNAHAFVRPAFDEPDEVARLIGRL